MNIYHCQKVTPYTYRLILSYDNIILKIRIVTLTMKIENVRT